MKILETKRLYLRELISEDKEELAKVLTDPESMKYYPAPFCDAKVESWILWNIDNYSSYRHGLWAVIKKEDNTFIGDCGITMQEIGDEVVPEIGFHIIKKHCNKGYATEAALACKQYAFESLAYTKLYLYAAEQNIASQRVAEKLGMTAYKYFEKNGMRQIAFCASKATE